MYPISCTATPWQLTENAACPTTTVFLFRPITWPPKSCMTLPGPKPSCAKADRSSYEFVAVWKAAGDFAQQQGARRPIPYRCESAVGQWGLTPDRSPTLQPRTSQGRIMSTNNARWDTAKGEPEKWSFRGPWLNARRCIVPAEDFDEPYYPRATAHQDGPCIWWRFRRAVLTAATTPSANVAARQPRERAAGTAARRSECWRPRWPTSACPAGASGSWARPEPVRAEASAPAQCLLCQRRLVRAVQFLEGGGDATDSPRSYLKFLGRPPGRRSCGSSTG